LAEKGGSRTLRPTCAGPAVLKFGVRSTIQHQAAPFSPVLRGSRHSIDRSVASNPGQSQALHLQIHLQNRWPVCSEQSPVDRRSRPTRSDTPITVASHLAGSFGGAVASLTEVATVATLTG